MDTFDRKLAAHRKKQSKPDPWTCAFCGQVFVVPELARLHEEKHLDD